MDIIGLLAGIIIGIMGAYITTKLSISGQKIENDTIRVTEIEKEKMNLLYKHFLGYLEELSKININNDNVDSTKIKNLENWRQRFNIDIITREIDQDEINLEKNNSVLSFDYVFPQNNKNENFKDLRLKLEKSIITMMYLIEGLGKGRYDEDRFIEGKTGEKYEVNSYKTLLFDSYNELLNMYFQFYRKVYYNVIETGFDEKLLLEQGFDKEIIDLNKEIKTKFDDLMENINKATGLDEESKAGHDSQDYDNEESGEDENRGVFYYDDYEHKDKNLVEEVKRFLGSDGKPVSKIDLEGYTAKELVNMVFNKMKEPYLAPFKTSKNAKRYFVNKTEFHNYKGKTIKFFNSYEYKREKNEPPIFIETNYSKKDIIDNLGKYILFTEQKRKSDENG